MVSLIDFSKPVYGTPTTQSVRDNFQIAQNEITSLQQLISTGPFLPLNGGIMTGKLELWRDPVANHEAATKQYVDAIAFAGGGMPDAPKNGFYYVRGGGETSLATENEWIIDPIFNSMKIWDANRVVMLGLRYDATFNYYDFGMNNSFFRFGRTSNVLELFINSIGVAGYSASAITFNSKVLPSNGISFGSLTSTSPTDFSKHIEFYTNFAGMSITGGRLNLNCNGSMVFLSGGIDMAFFDLSQGGLIFNSGATIKLSQDPTTGLHAATKQYVDTKAGQYLPLTGGTVNGQIFVGQNPNYFLALTGGGATTPGFISFHDNAGNRIGYIGYSVSSRFELAAEGVYTGWHVSKDFFVDKYFQVGLGATIYGGLLLDRDPTTALGAVTKQYVDTNKLVRIGVNGTFDLNSIGGNGGAFPYTNFIGFYSITNQTTPINFPPGQNVGFVIHGFDSNPAWQNQIFMNGGLTGNLPNIFFRAGSTLGAWYRIVTEAGVSADPTTPMGIATKQYVDGKVGGVGYMPTTGGTFTGGISFGARMAGASSDLSQHISLYDSWGGFNITSGSLNVIAGGNVAATFHDAGITIHAGHCILLDPAAYIDWAGVPTTGSRLVNKTYADTKLSLSGGAVTGQLRILGEDNVSNLILSGATKGIRFISSSNGSIIEGVDSTGVGSYQPLAFGGSSIDFNPPVVFYNSVAIATGKPLILGQEPTTAAHAVTKTYADTKLSLSGGTINGELRVSGGPSWEPIGLDTAIGSPCMISYTTATMNNWWAGVWAGGHFWIRDATASVNAISCLSGGMQVDIFGDLYVGRNITLGLEPTTANHAVTKQYVDTKAQTNNIGRNLIHNSMFNVQQRGQGPWTINSNYTADRWLLAISGGTASVTIQLNTDQDKTQIGDELAHYRLQTAFTGGSAAADTIYIDQHIEDIRRLSNKTVTISFWFTANAGIKVGVNLYHVFGTGGSPSVYYPAIATGVPFTATGAWQRCSLTINIPSVAGKVFGTNNDHATFLRFFFSSGSTNNQIAGNIGVQSGTINLWGVQLEVGSVMTQLEKPDPRYDLANCQRFYETGLILNGSYASVVSIGLLAASSFKVTKRNAPTVTILNNVSSNVSGATLGGSTDVAFCNAIAPAVGDYAINITYGASSDL